ncbi:MAG: hypothetical protein WBV82_31055 [Myxococcaceae bacterium]
MKKSTRWLVTAALAIPAVAFARSEEWERRYTVQAQGGAMAFAGEAATVTQPGAAYGVSISGDIVPWIAGELGYVGAAYRSEGIVSRTERSDIVENGGLAAVKVGPPVQWMIKPYALGGLSVQRLTVSKEENTGGLIGDGTEVRVPVGFGIELNPSETGLTVGARGTYAFSTNNNAFDSLGGANAASTWTGLAQLGGRF